MANEEDDPVVQEVTAGVGFLPSILRPAKDLVVTLYLELSSSYLPG